ncbi:MAG: hypothetical protein AAF702_03840 [Chloroflexota bacterium]
MTNPTPNKLEKPEFLLVFVLLFMLWSIGFVDLLTHISGTPETAVFGLYSRPVFVVLIGYGCLFFLWLGLLLWPRSHFWLPAQIERLQETLWLVIPLILIKGYLCWSLLTHFRWGDFPGLRAALFFFLLLVGAILLFANWHPENGARLWQKGLLYPIILLALLEGGIQGAAWMGRLPGQVTINTGLFTPNGRIYQNREGFANATTNNYGWYYPDFRLQPDESRIMLLGDSYIQALQIQPQEHMGVALEEMLNKQAPAQEDTASELSQTTEVLALGMPGFGPGLYLSDTRLADAVQVFRPQEIILFVHLANDFQIASGPDGYRLYHTVDANGVVTIHDESWQERHNLQHYILHGYVYDIDLVKTLKSHVLLPKVLRQVSANASPLSGIIDRVPELDTITIPQVQGVVLQEVELPGDFNDIRQTQVVAYAGASNQLFDKNASEETSSDRTSEKDSLAEDGSVSHAFAVLEGLIGAAHKQLEEAGVTLRIVTIPAFPIAFFEDTQDKPQRLIGNLDLLYPEERLRDMALTAGITYLASGEALIQGNLTVEQIQSFFYREGTGHLTPAGHRFMGEIVAECFYDYEPDTSQQRVRAGCYAE